MSTALGTGAARRTPAQLAWYWARRAWWMEIWGYVSIYRFIFRRPKVPRGAAPFSYSQPVLPLLIVFIVVSAIELVVVDVLVRRWESVRIALLVLGTWGLVWMFGLLFGFLTRPHSVGPDGIRVRSGAEVDIPLGWDEIASVVRRTRTTQDAQPQISTDEHGSRTLHLRMQHETNIDLVLRRPVTVRLPQGAERVSQIRLFADQPDALVTAADQLRVRALVRHDESAA